MEGAKPRRPSPSLRPAPQTRSASIGLALGSGGARGLAHIGAIQVLEEHEVPIDVVAGSSIGALVGALYGSGNDGEALHRIASDTTLLRIIPLFDPSLRHGFLGGTKLERLIKEFVSGRRVEECQIPLAVIATDLRSGEVVIFREGISLRSSGPASQSPGCSGPWRSTGGSSPTAGSRCRFPRSRYGTWEPTW